MAILHRKSPGYYEATQGDAIVTLKRRFDRTWEVKAKGGRASAVTVDTYAEAKAAAGELLDEMTRERAETFDAAAAKEADDFDLAAELRQVGEKLRDIADHVDGSFGRAA
jgi:hypothetical protein